MVRNALLAMIDSANRPELATKEQALKLLEDLQDGIQTRITAYRQAMATDPTGPGELWTCGHVAAAMCQECYRHLAAQAHELAEENLRLRAGAPREGG